MNKHRSSRDDVLDLDQLPPLAFSTVRLIELASDPDVDIDELASIIEQDPPLTARVLGMANSAFFGQATPILRVKHAIVQVLGLSRVRSLSLVMALAGSFDTRRCPGFDSGDYWLHSLLTATAASAIGRRLGDDEKASVDSLYLCGLLLNIGLLILIHVRPDEMSRILSAARQGDLHDAIATERDLLGIDRRQAGEWLAFRWHLPDVVVDTLASVADPSFVGDYPVVADIVRGAGQWAEGCLCDRQTVLRVPGVAAEITHAVEEEILPRLDRLQALAIAFTDRAPV